MNIVIPGGMSAFAKMVRKKQLVIPRRVLGAGLSQAAVTPIDSRVSTADLTQYDFTGFNLPLGRLLIGVGLRDAASSPTINSVLVNGFSAVEVAQVHSGGSNLNQTAVYQYLIASPLTNVSITVNLDGAGADRCGIDVVSANGLVDSFATSVANDPAANLTVPVRGAVYGYVFGVGTGTATWTGASEHTDEVVETTVVHSAAAAQVPAGGATMVTCDWSTAPSAGTGGVFLAISPP